MRRQFPDALGQVAEANLNEYHSARAHDLRALDVYRKVYAGTDYKIGITLDNLAVMDLKRKCFALAESEDREAIQMLAQTLPAGHPHLDVAEGHLGQILAKEHRDREAAHFLSLAYSGLQAQKDPPLESIIHVRAALHELYMRMGDQTHAAQFQTH